MTGKGAHPAAAADLLAQDWRPAKVSTADAVYRYLREAIIGGQLSPGVRIREVDVAKQLGVSRTPLREAIARLIGDRLVRRAPGGGLEVIDLATELLGMRHIRIALEGYAARLAASKIDEDELARLEQLLRVSTELPIKAIRERVDANTEFHARIFRASGVPQLVRAIETHAEYFIDEHGLQRFGPEETRKAVREHREILAALRARDGDKAERLVRDHLLSAFKITSHE